MHIIPAIDIKGGRLVRLWQGNFNLEKAYPQSPADAALMWQDKGAKRLHIVDLDGASSGELKNADIIESIRKKTNIILEAGGGIRTEDAVKRIFGLGIDYVVLGTKATDKEFLEKILKAYKKNIIVAVDVLEELVQVSGWLKASKITVDEYLARLQGLGVECIMYTDISRDGTLRGPDLQRIGNFLSITQIQTIISGGISGIKDIEALKGIDKDKKILGIIIGKALYEGKINIEEALRLQ